MIENLKNIPFFQRLEEADLQKIVDRVQTEHVPIGQVVFNENEEGNKMYIIAKGQVQVIRRGEVLALLKEGDFFGEMALVSDEPRNATIKTVDETELLTLNKDDFKLLLESNRSIASQVSYKVVKRANQIF